MSLYPVSSLREWFTSPWQLTFGHARLPRQPHVDTISQIITEASELVTGATRIFIVLAPDRVEAELLREALRTRHGSMMESGEENGTLVVLDYAEFFLEIEPATRNKRFFEKKDHVTFLCCVDIHFGAAFALASIRLILGLGICRHYTLKTILRAAFSPSPILKWSKSLSGTV